MVKYRKSREVKVLKCNICPRKCDVERSSQKGMCSMPESFTVARASKHFWEEPPISGTKGSGTVFFSGCNLGCVYCQNYEISHGGKGKEISDGRLTEIFDGLIASGVHNINLVNPTHYALRLKNVLSQYKSTVPVVYNSSGYERVSTLKSLSGLVDIYLPDLKYIREDRAEKYSNAPDYFAYASRALIQMKQQCPENIYDSDGIMQKGLILRHLILPKNTNQSIDILSWIKNNLGEDTTVSLMSQYTPCGKAEQYKELQRKITPREYEKVLLAAENMGFRNLFMQDPDSSDEKFIPDFDFSGL
ncbi:MAG: 4Fe-4S cluster-binding domain-containing protein [Clostridia bacterium]|nr:4Fe-4S cluster-binding domain-containing protein [Clostridia bacterium]